MTRPARERSIAAAIAALALVISAGAAVGIAFAAGAFSSGSSSKPASAAAPACLPASTTVSAKLPGVPVDVSPAPNTGAANPQTQISFLGVPPAEIREVSVTGQQSGRHAGTLHAYSQGDGASFVPASPFEPGEQVDVTRSSRRTAAPRRSPSPSTSTRRTRRRTSAEFPNPAAPPGEYQSFHTLPGVKAPLTDRDRRRPRSGGGRHPHDQRPRARRIRPPRSTRRRVGWSGSTSSRAATNAENLSVQSYEGRRDLTLLAGRVLSLGFGEGEDLVMTRITSRSRRVAGGNGLHADLHDFQIAPHDVAYITAYNPIRCDLASAEGASDGAIVDTAIQEIDMKHRARALGMAQPRPRRPPKTRSPPPPATRRRGTGSTSTRSTRSRTGTC